MITKCTNIDFRIGNPVGELEVIETKADVTKWRIHRLDKAKVFCDLLEDEEESEEKRRKCGALGEN